MCEWFTTHPLPGKKVISTFRSVVKYPYQSFQYRVPKALLARIIVQASMVGLLSVTILVLWPSLNAASSIVFSLQLLLAR